MSQQKSNNPNKSSPKNIQETKIYKDSLGAVKKFWDSYLNLLKTSFSRMPRLGQEQLIIKMCRIVTIGSALWFFSFLYPFLPTFARVLLLPVVVLASWWVGTHVVASVMIERFDRYLNKGSD